MIEEQGHFAALYFAALYLNLLICKMGTVLLTSQACREDGTKDLGPLHHVGTVLWLVGGGGH